MNRHPKYHLHPRGWILCCYDNKDNYNVEYLSATGYVPEWLVSQPYAISEGHEPIPCYTLGRDSRAIVYPFLIRDDTTPSGNPNMIVYAKSFAALKRHLENHGWKGSFLSEPVLFDYVYPEGVANGLSCDEKVHLLCAFAQERVEPTYYYVDVNGRVFPNPTKKEQCPCTFQN